MTTLGDANTLLNWATTTMTTDGWDVSSVTTLLPAKNLNDLTTISAQLQTVEASVRAALTEAWRPFWTTAQDQIWSEVPAVDLTVLCNADDRAKITVKRLMRLTSAVRMRKLAGG